MTCLLLDLGSAPVWLKILFISSEAMPRSVLVVMRHRYGISMRVPHTRGNARKPVVVSRNVGCFLRLTLGTSGLSRVRREFSCRPKAARKTRGSLEKSLAPRVPQARVASKRQNRFGF